MKLKEKEKIVKEIGTECRLEKAFMESFWKRGPKVLLKKFFACVLVAEVRASILSYFR